MVAVVGLSWGSLLGCSSSLQSRGQGGSSGSSATGGRSATGGTGGSPVDAGSIGVVCTSLISQYEGAVEAAQSCTVGNSGGCASLVHSSLLSSGCGCDYIYVSDATNANAIYQSWLSLGCQPKVVCSVGICPQPVQAAVCVSTDGGVSGVCNPVTSGIGGIPGTGGIGGAGGVAGGPDGGTGIPTAECLSIVANYQVALAAARVCNGDAGGQCGVVVRGDLPAYGCPTSCDIASVNDDTALNAIQMKWLAAGCQGFGACRSLQCPTDVYGVCAVGDGGQALCGTIIP
jgi:hypothetical protein